MTTTLPTPADHTTPSDGQVPPRRGRFSAAVRSAGERYALLVLLVVAYVLFTLLPATSESFPTKANFDAVLSNQAVVGILAIAAIFPLVAGYFDFTIGASAGLSAVVTAALLSKADSPVWLAVAAGCLSGVLIGLVNAWLVAKIQLNAFIVTLGVATLVTGLVQWYTGGLDISTNIPQNLVDFGSLRWLGIPRPLYLVVLVIGVSWYVMSQLPYGRKLEALGSNPRAARLVGVAVERHVASTFVISGFLAGLAGVVMVARNGGAVAGAGPDLLFPALAAVFLGATSVMPGKYNVPGTVVGVLFVSVVISGLTLAGAIGWVDSVFNGLTLIVAVFLSHLLNAQRTGSSSV